MLKIKRTGLIHCCYKIKFSLFYNRKWNKINFWSEWFSFWFKCISCPWIIRQWFVWEWNSFVSLFMLLHWIYRSEKLQPSHVTRLSWLPVPRLVAWKSILKTCRVSMCILKSVNHCIGSCVMLKFSKELWTQPFLRKYLFGLKSTCANS